MKDKADVEPLRLRNRPVSERKKEKRDPGRPTKYPNDPKQRVDTTIRKSLMAKKPVGMINSEYLEKCIMSSAKITYSWMG